ncbi:hypothetical protein [Streptomyces sp. NPDC086023]
MIQTADIREWRNQAVVDVLVADLLYLALRTRHSARHRPLR